MKIKFITDFRGVETKERFYQEGDVVELENGEQLVKDGRAIEVKAPAPKPEPKPEPTPKQPTIVTKRAGAKK
jgi:hypothetical protein